MYRSPACLGKAIIGMPGCLDLSAAMIFLHGSSAYLSKSFPFREPAQLSNIFITSAPAFI